MEKKCGCLEEMEGKEGKNTNYFVYVCIVT